jgi:predicted DNA-binding helix-hairpin-helix protein
MRFYGFSAPELTTPDSHNLDLAIDPKLAWALRNRDRFPVDLNVADRSELLRIPGVGVRSVDRILSSRRWRQLRMEDLTRLRIPLDRALPFIVVADHSPRGLPDAIDLRERIQARSQLDLFAVSRSAHTGEL